MSHVLVERSRATVEVRPDAFGDYTTHSVVELQTAVLAACRAVNNEAARSLATHLGGWKPR